MKRIFVTVTMMAPILFGCTSEKGRTGYNIIPVKKSTTGLPTNPSAQADAKLPSVPGTIIVPGKPFEPPVAPLAQPSAQPVSEPAAAPPKVIKVPPSQVQAPVSAPVNDPGLVQPTEPAKAENRIVFGQPGRPFEFNEFMPAGFSPEKTLSENEFIRERKARGCMSASVAGLTPGAEIATVESTFHQFDKAQIYFQMSNSNKLTTVKDGNIGYTRVIKSFQTDAGTGSILNTRENCNFIFGALGGFRKCPFVRGNEEYKKYVSQVNWGANCRSVSRDSSGFSRKGLYTRGKFTLPNGKVVRALLLRTKAARLETCDKTKRDYSDYSVQVISDGVQSADGTCATLFDLTVYQSKDRYSEWNKIVRSAPLKKK